MKLKTLQISISSAALILLLLHIIFPTLSIDAITIALFLAAILPWLTPLFESIKFPGGWEFQFRKLIEVEKEAKESGLISDPQSFHKLYDFEILIPSNNNLALAGLRIEIERQLRELANKRKLPVHNAKSIGSLLNLLYKENILRSDQKDSLFDITDLLNKAVHGAISVDTDLAVKTIEIGKGVLAFLEDLIDSQ